jgi:hypothetical protein
LSAKAFGGKVIRIRKAEKGEDSIVVGGDPIYFDSIEKMMEFANKGWSFLLENNEEYRRIAAEGQDPFLKSQNER